MSTMQVGDRVKHDFSLDHGTIKHIRKDSSDYNYFVEWDFPDRPDRNDWYKSEVLILL